MRPFLVGIVLLRIVLLGIVLLRINLFIVTFIATTENQPTAPPYNRLFPAALF
jgi:hypothetical protein